MLSQIFVPSKLKYEAGLSKTFAQEGGGRKIVLSPVGDTKWYKGHFTLWAFAGLQSTASAV